MKSYLFFLRSVYSLYTKIYNRQHGLNVVVAIVASNFMFFQILMINEVLVALNIISYKLGSSSSESLTLILILTFINLFIIKIKDPFNEIQTKSEKIFSIYLFISMILIGYYIVLTS